MSLATSIQSQFERSCRYPPYRYHSAFRHPPPSMFHHPAVFPPAFAGRPSIRVEYGYQRGSHGARHFPRAAVRSRPPFDPHRQGALVRSGEEHSPTAGAVTTDSRTSEASEHRAAISSSDSASPPAAADTAARKSAMCQVNELARHHKLGHQYLLTAEEGPAHQRRFTVTLHLGEQQFTAQAGSIRAAQQAAAAAAVLSTHLSKPPAKPRCSHANLMPTVELNTVASRRGESVTYTVVASASHLSGHDPHVYRAPYLRSRCQVEVRVGERCYHGVGGTVQAARHAAADQALQQLRQLSLPRQVGPFTSETAEGGADLLLKSPVSLVYEMARVRGLTVSFTIVDETGPAHLRRYVTRCEAGSVQADGEGASKKMSKRIAAECIMEKLKALPITVCTRVSGNRKGGGSRKSHNLVKLTSANAVDSGGDYSNHRPAESGGDCSNHLLASSVHPVSRLERLQRALRQPPPTFLVLREQVVARRRHFVVSASVGSTNSSGEGPNKRSARRAAAAALLVRLGIDTAATPVAARSALRSANHDPTSQTRQKRRVTFQGDNEEFASAVKDTSDSTADDLISATNSQQHLVSSRVTLSIAGDLSPSSDPTTLFIASSSGNTPVSYNETESSAKSVETVSAVTGSGSSVTGSGSSVTGSASSVTASVGSVTGAVGDKCNRQPIPGVLVVNSCPSLEQPETSVSDEMTSICNETMLCDYKDRIGNCSSLINGRVTVSAHQRLIYLSKLLGFTVQCTDIPQVSGRSYLCLLSLNSSPPHIGHGCGASVDEARAHAAQQALASLSRLGLSDDQLEALNTGGRG